MQENKFEDATTPDVSNEVPVKPEEATVPQTHLNLWQRIEEWFHEHFYNLSDTELKNKLVSAKEDLKNRIVK